MAQIVTLEDPLLGNHMQERSKKSARNVLIIAVLISLLLVLPLPLCYNYLYSNGSIKESWRKLLNGVTKTKSKSHEDGDIVESDVGVVAAEDSRCSDIGISVLREGGHAVDAAVATAICLGVVNPMSSGIGGGGFMVLRDAQTGISEAYNFREMAPMAASQDMYASNPSGKQKGALSIAVPGEVAGLHAAWLQHGRLLWETLFQPSIKLAGEGFVVAPCLEKDMKMCEQAIMADSGLRKVFAPKGKLLEAGEICYNPKLAHSLQVISQEGPRALYNSSLGERLVDDVQKAGGILTMDDMRHYKVEVKEAMSVDVMGYNILGMPPPSSGTVGLSLVLKILESYGVPDGAKGLLGVHRLIESVKHMFAVRMDLGDPNFVNITNTVMHMLSSSFAKQIQQQILDNATFPSDYYRSKWNQVKEHGTSHFCIVDADRNALSMTTTVNYYFGAGVLSPSTGIVINNEMDDFSVPSKSETLPPAPSNFIQPKKRPLSSMAPIIITKDNQLAGVLGGSGGSYITTGVIQVFLNHFVFGMKPLDAILQPRVYHTLTPNVLYYENITAIDGEHIELSHQTRLFLEGRGHILKARAGGASCELVVHNLHDSKTNSNGVAHGVLTAVSDPRKDGRPAGI